MDYEDMRVKQPIWWDWYWIQGGMIGFEWDWQDGWITINLAILKILICYK